VRKVSGFIIVDRFTTPPRYQNPKLWDLPESIEVTGQFDQTAAAQG
jgi:hypothetical protein